MATDADTNVEKANANVNAVAYTAYPPPSPSPVPREKLTAESDGLTPAQAEMHKKVLEHFRSESYKLPGVKEKEEGGGELRDEERFWLVRFSLSFFFPSFFWLMIGGSFCSLLFVV